MNAAIVPVGLIVHRRLASDLALRCLLTGTHDVSRVEGDRLLLRSWRDEDRQVFARMEADPDVMDFFVAPLTREGSDAFVDRIEAAFR